MSRMPTLFVSHGAPTFALQPGCSGARFAELGRTLPKPAAVLVISPHWMTPEPRVTIAPRPSTLHDFGGFDPALYEIRYPAAGHPAMARRAAELLCAAGRATRGDPERGFDHGAWVPLLHLYPDADVPLIQVSQPTRLDGPSAWEFGRALAPLADDGVLIIGSGSLTHNLYELGSSHAPRESYAAEFAEWVRDTVHSGDAERLQQVMTLAPHARRAHPTAEHLWPLLIAAGAAGTPLAGDWIEGGIRYGVLSMDSCVFGLRGMAH